MNDVKIASLARRNATVSICSLAFSAIAFGELAVVIYLWSDAESGTGSHWRALADLSGMARIPLMFIVALTAAVFFIFRVIQRDWSSVAYTTVLAGLVMLSFPALLAAEKAVQRTGANRVAERAQPLIKAIEAYERERGQIGHLDNLKSAGKFSSLPTPGIRGAGQYRLESYDVGDWELSVVVPIHWCSYAVMFRREPGRAHADDFARDGWRLRCN